MDAELDAEEREVLAAWILTIDAHPFAQLNREK